MRMITWAALAVVALTLAHLTFLATTPGNIDDAFIVLVYARHLIASGDYWFDAAQVPLDGFTSILDLWVKAALIRVTGADPVRIAWLVTVAYHLGAVLAAIWLLHQCICAGRGRGATGAREADCSGVGTGAGTAGMAGTSGTAPAIGAGRTTALAALVVGSLALATNWALAEGASFLLETPLAVMLICVATGIVLGEALSGMATGVLAIVLVLLILARPEGLLVAPILLVLAWWRHRLGAARRGLLLAGAWVAICACVYLVWHLVHFGYWAPNTYYAKTADHRIFEIEDGLTYVAAYLHIPIGIIIAAWTLLGPVVLRRVRWTTERDRLRYLTLAAMPLILTAIVIVEGGDCYAGERFLAAPAMMAIAALAFAAGRAGGLPGRLALTGLVVVVVVQGWDVASAQAQIRERLADQWPLSSAYFDCERGAIGQIARRVPAGRLAQVDDQRIKYFADQLTVLDLDGLNDRSIAHAPSEGHVTFGKFKLETALDADAEVFVYGWKTYLHVLPMAAHSLTEVLASDSLRAEFIGLDAPAPRLRDRLVARYRTASIATCGYYFNVLVRADVVDRFLGPGILLGPARPGGGRHGF